MKYIKICIFLLISLTAKSEDILLLADQWCPYNCNPKTQEPGFVVEVTRKIFAEKGHNIIYKVEGWARSILLVKEGKANGVIGANLMDAPGFIFPTEKFMTTSNVFIVKKSSKIKKVTEFDIYNSKYNLGVIKGYSYSKRFDSYIKKAASNINIVHGALPIRSLIPMLNLNRIDVALEEIHVWMYNSTKLGYDPDSYKNVGLMLAGDMYIAFSPKLKSSKLYAKILSEGLKKMKSDGSLKKIMKKYYIQDI